ncbi:uncharacterized protein LOC134239665 [Saccostrea cucullata]|uniref:uncharacterized protein LOC134239665 n=1 Tax=Saccostrea cuccullata TaxID=36930 RepID=UPI002ED4C3C1
MLKLLMLQCRFMLLVLAGVLCIVRGQYFEIWTEFVNGDVTFKWTNVSSLRNDILIINDSESSDWVKTYEDQYTVTDVLRYKSVTIEVREYNTTEITKGHVDYIKTYNVIISETKEGESKNISWTANYRYFLEDNFYRIFHDSHNGLRTRIIKIKKDEAKSTTKYVYHTRPLNSVHILFEVKNITLEDAGYYVGGVKGNKDEGGVVLVVHGKPVRPVIKGEMTIRAGNLAFLECVSRSTSTPYYYKRFPPLSYLWYTNNTRIDGENRETYNFSVSKNVKYNKYSCQVKETVESERSNEVNINPLYGPDKVIISPQLTMNVLKLQEGDKFGPYHCSADCSPPCTFQWFHMNSTGGFEASYQSNSTHVLQQQTSNRTRTRFYCVAYWPCEGNYTNYSNLTLDIQYLYKPVVYVNGVAESYLNISQNAFLTLSCFTDGNPAPIVTISRGTRNKILGKGTNTWVNYTFPGKAQCTDSNIYRCEGSSKQYPSKVTTIFINIPCKPRLDDRMEFESTVYIKDLPTSVTVNVPIISNPKPRLVTWNGPLLNFDISTTMSQRNEVYQHWVSSTITILNESFLGNYTVFGEGIKLVTIEVREIDTDFGSPPPQWKLWLIVQIFAGLFVLLIIVSIICKATCKSSQGRSPPSKENPGVYDIPSKETPGVYDIPMGSREEDENIPFEYHYLTMTAVGSLPKGQKTVDEINDKLKLDNQYENVMEEHEGQFTSLYINDSFKSTV